MQRLDLLRDAVSTPGRLLEDSQRNHRSTATITRVAICIPSWFWKTFTPEWLTAIGWDGCGLFDIGFNMRCVSGSASSQEYVRPSERMPNCSIELAVGAAGKGEDMKVYFLTGSSLPAIQDGQLKFLKTPVGTTVKPAGQREETFLSSDVLSRYSLNHLCCLLFAVCETPLAARRPTTGGFHW